MIWLVEIGLVLYLGAKAQKNPTIAIAGFVAYALLNGVTLSVTLLMYTGGTVAGAFKCSSYLWRDVISRCLYEERPISSWSCRL